MEKRSVDRGTVANEEVGRLTSGVMMWTAAH